MFPYERNRDDMEPKAWVAGARYKGAEKAYPLDRVPAGDWMEDTIGERAVMFRHDADAGLFELRDADGEEIPVVHVYWFAWQAFFTLKRKFSKRAGPARDPKLNPTITCGSISGNPLFQGADQFAQKRGVAGQGAALTQRLLG